jgi:hypothetical protein
MAFFAATLTMTSPPAHAEEVHFSGQTTVDMVVAKDVLQNIQQIGLAELGCGVIQDVQSEIMPASYAPAATDNYAGQAKETYERWKVTLCGKSTSFLLGFWPAPEGGTDFHVSYPFPRDASAVDGAAKGQQ